MLVQKLEFLAITLLFLGTVATAAAGYGKFARTMKDEPVKTPAGQQPPTANAAKPDSGQPKPTVSRMFVVGRVLGPDGKPVKGAVVDVLTRPRSPRVGASDEIDEHALLGQAQSDADGRFQVDSPRTASTRVFEVYAVAAAPGHGLGWAELNPDDEQPVTEIRLQPEELVRARLVEVTGAPAKGVEVVISGIGRINEKGIRDGISPGTNSPKGTRAWPSPVKTDDDGRIALPGIGQGALVGLHVSDLRYARQELLVDPAKASAGKETTIALEPARIIEGRVLAADTGRPMPNATVSASALVMNESSRGYFVMKFRADLEGRFAMNPTIAESYTLAAFPAGGEPYLIQQDEFQWTKGAVKATHDIKVRRGSLIRGKVTEDKTGRPLPASSIMFIPVRDGERVLSGWQAIVASQNDGSFQIAVPTGKGHLLVFGPAGDYVLGEIGSNRLYYDRPGGQRYRAHAIIPYEVKTGDSPQEVIAALRPGVTIKGRALGPDGQTITGGFVLTTLRIEPFNPFWRGDYNLPIRDGRFELHGLAPDSSTRIHVLDPEHMWGASVEVSGKQAGEGLTVHLQPCGQAEVRFVTPDGKPVAHKQPLFEIVATPGPGLLISDTQKQTELAADASIVANVDRKHYWDLPGTDAEGRITLISLIPGALYRITDYSPSNDQKKRTLLHKDFTVKAGETLDLGDIVIETQQQ
jgi:hypothetical protein